MKVRKLTEQQKNQLIGKTYDGTQFFNPVQDVDGNWVISNEEVDKCLDLTEIGFIQFLPEINYNPKFSIIPLSE
jgi:hypothetical protein